MSQKVATTVLKWSVDQSSAQSVVATNKQISASFDATSDSAQAATTQYNNMASAASQLGMSAQDVQALTDQTDALGVSATATADQTVAGQAAAAAGYDATAQSVQSLIRDIGDLGRDIESIPEPDLSAFGVDEGGGDSGGGSFKANPRAISSLGRLAGPSAGGGVIQDVANIARLTAVFGPLGAAAGVGALALNAVTSAEQARAAAAQASADTLNKIATGSATDTTADIQKRIDANKLIAKTQEEAIQPLTDLTAQYKTIQQNFQDGKITNDQYIAQLGKLDDDTKRRTNGVVDDYGSVGGALTDLQGKLKDTNASITADSIELGTHQVKLNDAAAATAELNADLAKLPGSLHTVSTAVTDALTHVADGKAVQQGFVDFGSEIGSLLKQGVSSVLSATDAQLSAQNTKSMAAVTAVVQAQDEISATTADIAKAQADSAAKQVAAYSDEQTKIADIQQQGAQKVQDIQKDNAAEVAKIVRDGGQALAGDRADRDALQYYKDKQSENNKLADQQTADDKSLSAQQTQQAQSIKSAQTAYATQEANLKTALATEVATKQEALQTEKVALANLSAAAQTYAAFVEQSAERVAEASQTASAHVVKGGESTFIGSVVAGNNSAAGSAVNRNVVENAGGPSGANVVGLAPVMGSYALGTPYVPRTGPAMLHQGEAVIPAGQNGLNLNFSAVINATTARAIQAQVDARLAQYLKEAGIS